MAKFRKMYGEISPEEIAALKEKHGAISKITIEDKVCYVKQPSRKTMGYFASSAEKNPVAAQEMLLNDCFVAGDEEIKTNDDYFYGAIQQLGNLIQVKEAKLEKL